MKVSGFTIVTASKTRMSDLKSSVRAVLFQATEMTVAFESGKLDVMRNLLFWYAVKGRSNESVGMGTGVVGFVRSSALVKLDT